MYIAKITMICYNKTIVREKVQESRCIFIGIATYILVQAAGAC
jgi:hypothetical protein